MFIYSTWVAGAAMLLPPMSANLEQTHVPNTIHIASMDWAPEFRTHRMALQCGADARTGDIRNPNTDMCAQ